MKSATILQQPYILPCDVNIPNRIVKSAIIENNADKGGKPSERIIMLYKNLGKK